MNTGRGAAVVGAAVVGGGVVEGGAVGGGVVAGRAGGDVVGAEVAADDVDRPAAVVGVVEPVGLADLVTVVGRSRLVVTVAVKGGDTPEPAIDVVVRRTDDGEVDVEEEAEVEVVETVDGPAGAAALPGDPPSPVTAASWVDGARGLTASAPSSWLW